MTPAVRISKRVSTGDVPANLLLATSEAPGDIDLSDVAADLLEYRVFVNAGKTPPAVGGRRFACSPRLPAPSSAAFYYL